MATKTDLINNLVKKLDYLKYDDAAGIVDMMLEYIKDELTKGNRVEIRGFGSLSIRKRKIAGKEAHYNTVYYRMSKNVQANLSQNMAK